MKWTPFIFMAMLSVTIQATNTLPSSEYQPKANYEHFLDFFTSNDSTSQDKALDIIEKRWTESDEILAIKLPKETDESIAVSSKFLKRNTIYQDKSGAHRVYYTNDRIFTSYDKHRTVIDGTGKPWTLHENYMGETDTSIRLERFQSFSAFWFGYKAASPNIRLVK